MDVAHVDVVTEAVGPSALVLVEELFARSSGRPPGVDASRFRADHPDWMDELDRLVSSELLLKRFYESDTYRVRAFALPLLKNPQAAALLDGMEKAYQLLREHYRKNLRAPIQGNDIAPAISEDQDFSIEVLFYMRDVDGWWSGIGNDFPIGESQFVVVNEEVLRHTSFSKFISRVYEWNYLNPRKQTNDLFSGLVRKSGPTMGGFLTSEERALSPKWFDKLDDTKKALIEEIDVCLQHELSALPVMGLRTLLETIMVDYIGHEGSFSRKLAMFAEAQYITGQHADMIRTVLDAGHASVHRAYFPNSQDVNVCVEVVKHLIHGLYVLHPEVRRLAENMPADPRTK